MKEKKETKVIFDFENIIDSLLAHTKEENCQHTITDFLNEYFDKQKGLNPPAKEEFNRRHEDDNPTLPEGELLDQ